MKQQGVPKSEDFLLRDKNPVDSKATNLLRGEAEERQPRNRSSAGFSICVVKDCNRRMQAKGLCLNHYSQLRQFGKIRTLPPRPDLQSNKKCKIKNCNIEHYAKGYCRNHWTNWKRCGNPLGIGRKGKYVNCKICKRIIYKCLSYLKNCKHHFCSVKCWGIYFKKHNPNWRGGVAEYPNHSLMKKNRLIILLNNPKCEICNKPATQIHHRNGDKSDHRLSNLMPSCQSCNSKIRFKPNKSKYRSLYGMTLQEMEKKFKRHITFFMEKHRRNELNSLLKSSLIIFLLLFLPTLSHAEPHIDTTKAVIHHTASHDVSAEEIDRWHKQNNWKGNGYHYVIRQDGAIENGRVITEKGAHADDNGRNYWVGIVLTGNDIFTLTQKISLMKLLKILRITKVERHHELCPGDGFDVEDVQRELDGEYKRLTKEAK